MYSQHSILIVLTLVAISLFSAKEVQNQELNLTLARERLLVNHNDLRLFKDIHITETGFFLLFNFTYSQMSDLAPHGVLAYFHNFDDELSKSEWYDEMGKVILRQDYGYYDMFNQQPVTTKPENEQIQWKILQLDNIIHIPNNSDHSYQYTISGEFLGYKPNFAETEESFRQTIQIGNASKMFPIQIFENTYTDAIDLETNYILISEDVYTIVGKQDLIKSGNLSKSTDFPRELLATNNKVYPQSIHPLPDDYFITYVEWSPFKLYQAKNGIVEEININNPVYDIEYSSSLNYFHLDHNYLYQINFQGVAINLYIYEYSGITLSTSAIGNYWEDFH